MSILKSSCNTAFHPDSITCNESYRKSVVNLFRAVVRSSGPIYVISAVQKEGFKIGLVKLVLQTLVKTSAFYVTSVTIYSFLRCCLRDLLGYHNRLAIFCSGVLGYGVGSLLEDHDQLLGILVFQGKDTISNIGMLAIVRGLIPYWKNGSVIVFAIAMAALNYYAKLQPKYCSPIPNLLMKAIVGTNRDNLEQKILRLLQNNSIVPNINNNANWTLIDVIIGSSKNFVVGYTLKTILGLVVAGFSSSSIKESFSSIHSSSVTFARFLGALLAINRGLPILLKKLFGDDNDSVTTVITGFFMGLSMYLWPASGIACFALSNAICSVLTDISHRKIFPPMPYFVNFLYGLSTGITLYALQFENQTVPDGWKQGLLSKMAGGQDVSFYQKLSEQFGKALGLSQIVPT